jgi:spermidine/putrescine transport system ATP-binding protein
LEKRRPDQLSGGQQQRVAVARSLVLQPEVLLLDEPLAALDRKLRKEMQIELRRIQRDVGITFIYVTHDQKEALSMSDRIAVMKDGKVAQLGEPRDIYENPATQFVADFMGASNVFDARITEQNDVQLTLQTEMDLAVFASVGNLVADQTVVGFSVRPESVNLHTKMSEARADNVFKGSVSSMIYFGDVIEVEIELVSQHQIIAFLSTSSTSESLTEGQDVWVSWAASDSNLLMA